MKDISTNNDNDANKSETELKELLEATRLTG
jgi:hypothetical protein